MLTNFCDAIFTATFFINIFSYRELLLGNMSLAHGNMMNAMANHQSGLDMQTFQTTSKLFEPNCTVTSCYSDYE